MFLFDIELPFDFALPFEVPPPNILHEMADPAKRNAASTKVD